MKVKATMKTVKIADIHTNLFVRGELDQDHALYLGDLIEAGVSMRDMIEVTERDGLIEIVDGRHRKEGYELAKVSEVKVKVLDFDSEAEMIAYAYRANTGGSKPPTPADTEHTIMLLIQQNEGMKRIGELLGLPTSLARRYATEVKSRMNRAQLQRAAGAVTEGGLTVTKAAAQYDVDPEKLKEILSGHIHKVKNGVAECQRNLSTLYKSVGLKNARLLKSLIEKYEDGDVNAKQMLEIFKHLEDLQKKSSKVTVDWKARFQAIVDKSKEDAA